MINKDLLLESKILDEGGIKLGPTKPYIPQPDKDFNDVYTEVKSSFAFTIFFTGAHNLAQNLFFNFILI